MKKNVFARLSVCLAALAGIFLTVSCNQVGLGEAVDVAAPNVDITYPPKNSIIRGTFKLAGTCSDETGIKSVSVTVRNTDLSEDLFSGDATVTNGTSWAIDLNRNDESNEDYYAGWELPDGKYSVSVIATDLSGRVSGTSSLAFDIDNTAPVFVISKPGVVKVTGSAQSEYGSVFKIEGTISELHDVSTMDVTVYNEDGTEILSSETYEGEEIKAFRETDVGKGGVTVKIAQWADTSSTRYETVYGKDKEIGDIPFLCSVKLTDNAQSYTTPDTLTDTRSAAEQKEDSLGNSTAEVYLNDDIYNTLLSQKDENSAKLSVDNLRDILNGTLKIDSLGLTDKQKEKLANKIDTSAVQTVNEETGDTVADVTKGLYFSLNPNANPTYSITGYDFYTSGVLSESINTAAGGYSLTVYVKASLDDTNIDLDGSEEHPTRTTKVWMADFGTTTPDYAVLKSGYEALDKWVKEQEDGEESYTFIEYKTDSKNATTYAYSTDSTKICNFVLLYDYAQNKSDPTKDESSVSNGTFEVSPPKGLITVNNYYIVVVTGADLDDIEYQSTNFYGFKGTNAGATPELTIDSTSSLVATSDEIEITGTVKMADTGLYVKQLAATLTVTDQASKNAEVFSKTYTITKAGLNSEWVTVNGFECTGGKWTFTPSELDDYEEFEVEKSSGKNYACKLTVTAVSSSDHKISAGTTVQIDSILPIVAVSSITPTVDGDTFDESDNVYVNDLITVSANITESNLSDVYMQIFTGDSETAVKYDGWKDADGNTLDKLDLGKTYSVTQTIDTTKLTDETSLDIRITAVDEVDNEFTYSTLSATGSSYKNLIILQKTDNPVITLNNASNSSDFTTDATKIDADNNMFGTTTNNKLNVSVTDDKLIKKVVMTVYTEDGTTQVSKETKEPGKATASYQFTLPSDEGVYAVEISATDGVSDTSRSETRTALTTTTGKFFVAVSAGSPTITLKQNKSYYQTEFTLTGTVAGQNVTVKAEYLDSDGNALKDIEAKDITVTGGSFTVTVDISALDDNCTTGYKAKYTVTDRFKQTSYSEVTFYKDKTIPDLNGDKTKIGGVALDSVASTWFVSGGLNAELHYTDNGSGVEKIYIWFDPEDTEDIKNNVNASSTCTPSKDEENGTWRFSSLIVNSLTEQTEAHVLKIKAVDYAGNESAVSEYAIKVDGSVPDFAGKYYSYDKSDFEEIGGTVLSNGKKTLYVYGNISDSASGVAEFTACKIGNTSLTLGTTEDTVKQTFSTKEIKDTSSITDDSFKAYSTITDKTSIKAWKLEIPAKLITSGQLKVDAADTAGNCASASYVCTLSLDNAAPSVKFTNPAVSDGKAVKSVYGTVDVTGTVTDSGSVKSYDIYYSTKESNNLSDYKKLTESSVSVNSNSADFSQSVDFNTLSGAEDAMEDGAYTGKGTLYLFVAATDSAENANYTDGSITESDGFAEISVNMNDDVPKVRITNLTLAEDSYWLVNGTDAAIEGTVKDTDGISEFRIFEEPITASDFDSSGNLTKEDASGSKLTFTDGESFTYQPASTEDGEKSLYFYVKDSNGTVFYTGKNTEKTFTEPTVQVRDGTATPSASAFKYTSDGTAPGVSSVEIAYCDSKDGTYSDYESFTGSSLFGGSVKRYVKFRIKATDDNGIVSASLTLKATDLGITLDTETLTPSLSSDGSYVAESKVYDLGDKFAGKIGTVKASVSVSDSSGQKGSADPQFTVDNQAPETFTVTSPSSGSILTSDVTMSGVALDGSGSGISSVQFAVPTAAQKNAAVIGTENSDGISAVILGNDVSVSFAGDLKENSTAAMWTFEFNSSSNGGQLTQYTNAYDEDNSAYALTKSGFLYTIPVWFRVEDKLGNEAVYQFNLTYNPNGNWPTAKVTTPKTETILGTSASFAGSATDNKNVKNVYIQFDLNGDGVYDSTDKGLFEKSNDETVCTASDLSPNSGGAITGSDTDWWGVLLDGTTSWSGQFTLPETGDADKYWHVRACAIDDESIIGLWSDGSNTTASGTVGTVAFRVDDKAPHIGTKTLYVKYCDDSDTALGTKTYSSDMYISNSVAGKWKLVIDLYDDDSGINKSSIKVTEKAGSGSTVEITTWEATEIENETYPQYLLEIPLNTENDGTVTYTITTSDNSKPALSTSATYSFTVDNQAPTLSAVQFRSENLDMNKLYNTNYEAEISSVVTDSGAGMASLNFFFERGGNYYVPFAGGSEGSWKMQSESGRALSLTDGLPSVTATGTGEAGSNMFTISDTTGTDFVRAGGIVKIDGSYYNITAVEDGVVTFDGKLANAVTNATFIYALTVNYTTTQTESSSWTNGTYAVTGDDGDGLVEGVTKSGAKWTCTASLLTDSIEDGTIVLHAIAIDAAGNISEDLTTRTMISNNEPRLTKVYLANDLNGDGSYSASEVDGFSALDENGKAQEYMTLATDVYDLNSKVAGNTNGNATDPKAYFKVTGDFVVVPEFVSGKSGQGTIWYDAVALDGGSSNSEPTWNKNGSLHGSLSTTDSPIASAVMSETDTDTALAALGYLKLSGTDVNTTFSREDKVSVIALSLWDSAEVYEFTGSADEGWKTGSKATDGTAGIYDSDSSCYTNFGYQWTVANIPVYIDISDDIIPYGTITPFYWNGRGNGNNSLQWQKDGDEYTNTPLGHIEYETTPSVSGAIKVEGTAADDQLLGKIAVTYAGNAVGEISYTAGTATWSTSGTLSSDGYNLSVTENTLDQTGHKAQWTLLLDTAKFGNANAKELKITATQSKKNKGNETSTSEQSAVQTTAAALTNYYSVNAVPYITGIERPSNSTISIGHKDYGNINRSKLGNYSVAEGESLTVKGWNFGTAGSWTVGSNTATDYTATADSNGLYSFTMTVPAKSGALKVTQNSIDSLNNSNTDPEISGNELTGTDDHNLETFQMRGNSTKYYAGDNRYLEVWNLGNGFKNTTDGTEFQQPVMTADYSGNLFASWGAASNGQIVFSYGVSGAATPIFNCYDQPAQYSAVAYDRSDKSGNKTGGASVLYFGEQQGQGGTYSDTGLSSSMIIGGAFVTNVPNSYISASTTSTAKTHVVTDNPTMRMDSENTTGFFNLASYDMTRRLGSFANPKAERYGNYMHNIWYDSYTESLKYSVVDLGSETVANWSNHGAAMAGWVVLDGGYSGQDRLHEWSAQSSTNSTNNELSSGGGYHTVTRKAATSTTHQSGITRFTTDIFLGSGTPKASARSPYISTVTSTSLTMKNVTYATAPEAGDTIALMCNDAGSYTIELRCISSVSGNTIYWKGELTTDASLIDSATIYEGALNVVGGSLDDLADSGPHKKESSSGSSADMKLDQNGMPVVAYYDDSSETLRIVKATTVKPELAANWVRTTTDLGCAGGVSLAVDTGNNIHIVYKNTDSQMCYVFGTVQSDSTYELSEPEIIDSSTTSEYVSVSVIETASSKVPCVSYLASAGTAQSLKYAYRTSAPSESGTFSADNWDYMILPSLGTGRYAIAGNPVSTEGRTTGWNGTDTTVLTNGGTAVTPAAVQTVVAFKSKTQFETAYLKTE